jgi:hypothetical protein
VFHNHQFPTLPFSCKIKINKGRQENEWTTNPVKKISIRM